MDLDQFIEDKTLVIDGWIRDYTNNKTKYERDRDCIDIIEKLNKKRKNKHLELQFLLSPNYSDFKININNVKTLPINQKFPCLKKIISDFQTELNTTIMDQSEPTFKFFKRAIKAQSFQMTNIIKKFTSGIGNRFKKTSNDDVTKAKEMEFDFGSTTQTINDLNDKLVNFSSTIDKWEVLNPIFLPKIQFINELLGRINEINKMFEDLVDCYNKMIQVNSSEIINEISKLNIECKQIGTTIFKFPKDFDIKQDQENDFVEHFKEIHDEREQNKSITLLLKAETRKNDLLNELADLEKSFSNQEKNNEFALEILEQTVKYIIIGSKSNPQVYNRNLKILDKGYRNFGNYYENESLNHEEENFGKLEHFIKLIKDNYE